MFISGLWFRREAPAYRVVPVEGGRWMLMGPTGEAVLGDRDFPSREVALEALGELVRARRVGRRIRGG